ncbi:cyclase family protein [Halioxenophilus aromaticivorans]
MSSQNECKITTLSGALRYIDQAAIQRGMSSVSEFRATSIGLEIQHGKGPVAPMRQFPQHYLRRDGGDYASGKSKETQGFGFSDDVLIIGTHGTSHVDALCHIFCEGTMFGGYSSDEVSSTGSKKLGAETIPPIVTRAIVIDAVPDNTAWLEPGVAIHAADLQSRLDEQGITPEPGDALIVRTGWVEFSHQGNLSGFSAPGLSADTIEWVRHHKFAVIGADNIAVEVGPSEIADTALPLHASLMHQDGLLFLELLDLSSIKGKVTTAMFSLNPLKIVGGTASPVAPMLMY